MVLNENRRLWYSFSLTHFVFYFYIWKKHIHSQYSCIWGILCSPNSPSSNFKMEILNLHLLSNLSSLMKFEETIQSKVGSLASGEFLRYIYKYHTYIHIKKGKTITSPSHFLPSFKLALFFIFFSFYNCICYFPCREMGNKKWRFFFKNENYNHNTK